ncbi:MAG TPA: alpha-galactosidase, partial [Clostridiaceae bacterium]|nr:alpha-galactosidase [Clostridiaceae bacterium]
MMITCKDKVFRLDTSNTTYMFRITGFGHLEHVYYGILLDEEDSADVMAWKTTVPVSGVNYDESDRIYNLDIMCLEWSDNGRGDYRQSPSELMMPDGTFVSDFIYHSHRIVDGSVPMNTLPSSYGGDQTLEITLKDTTSEIYLVLYYTVYEKADCITRRAVLKNESDSPLVIRRLMSMMVDLPDEKFRMYTLDGGWIREAHLHERPVEYGIIINSSNTGTSSNRHNPAFMLAS